MVHYSTPLRHPAREPCRRTVPRRVSAGPFARAGRTPPERSRVFPQRLPRSSTRRLEVAAVVRELDDLELSVGECVEEVGPAVGSHRAVDGLFRTEVDVLELARDDVRTLASVDGARNVHDDPCKRRRRHEASQDNTVIGEPECENGRLSTSRTVPPVRSPSSAGDGPPSTTWASSTATRSAAAATTSVADALDRREHRRSVVVLSYAAIEPERTVGPFGEPGKDGALVSNRELEAVARIREECTLSLHRGDGGGDRLAEFVEDGPCHVVERIRPIGVHRQHP